MIIKLVGVTIHRYKCFSHERHMEVEEEITVLTGENESGKTCTLEAMAKANYFNREDARFSYHKETDYPRVSMKELDGGAEPAAVTLDYAVSEELAARIREEMLIVPLHMGFSRTTDYSGKCRVENNGFSYDTEQFWEAYAAKFPEIAPYRAELCTVKSISAFRLLLKKCGSPEERTALAKTEHFFVNRMNWGNPLSEYVYRTYLLPNIPRFLYYDAYGMLPSKVSLHKLAGGDPLTPPEQTAKALLLLAGVKPKELLENHTAEGARTLLEQMSRDITEGFLPYWSANRELRIEFALSGEKNPKETAECGEKPERTGLFRFLRRREPVSAPEKTEPETYLETRVYDIRDMISLPLGDRSGGFNWFLSFYIWFMAMEKSIEGSCVFLLDEPGQKLHASAQEDLMEFLKHISQKHQVILTTHSMSMAAGKEWEGSMRRLCRTPAGSDIIRIQEKGAKRSAEMR